VSSTTPAPRSPRRLNVFVAGLALLVGLAAAPAASARTASPASPAVAGEPGGSFEATTGMLEGIDISHWQGTINWSLVAGAGKKFAIMKATESTNYTDPTYASNHSRAKAAGLWTGAYHFARPGSNANDAKLEAAYFASAMNLGVGDLIPALDLEDSGGLSVAALQAWVTSFLGEVYTRVGVRPMIYTSPAFWKKYMGDSRALADAGYKTLWVAHWGVTMPTIPAANWGGRGWTFWQYSSTGTVPGIAGRVDLDRFNGTDLATQAYSIFRLTASHPAGSVKQGASSAANVAIVRTNFTAGVALQVSGLPAGTTATFGANPATATSTTMTVTTPTDPTATPTGTYPLTITGESGGLTRTTKLNLVVSDGIPPTLTAPKTMLWSGRTLGTSTVPVRITWSATDPSGVTSSGLQRSANGGSWTTTALPSAAALAADSSIPIGGTARHHARAGDAKANVSPWLAGTTVRASVYQQSSSAITYTGAWHTTGSSSASGGSVRYATAKGASATFRFTGSSVAWVAAKGSTRGSVWIYVDGAYAASVSLRSSTGQSRAIVFARNWLTVGTHTLKIVVAGTAGHPRIDVDAFVRLAPG
jgi:GH25 family lysozyme M1 (1,4-beta-N-acetylmuramidase)